MESDRLHIRPYARLLTMLGDQLIKNERIALVELIKNAYDADADHVEVRFEDFGDDMTPNGNSRIVVQDDGTGMSLETVRTRWMNPAAPQKYLAKRNSDPLTPLKRRVIQGEKGIGRFAILKLGRLITVTTRQPDAESETALTYDFCRFDDDFVTENQESRTIFLDEITVDCRQSPPNKISDHGTIIEISALKGSWNDAILEKLCRDVSNLTDPVSRLTHRESPDRFEITVFCNGNPKSVVAEDAESLKALIEDKSVLKIQGHFASTDNAFFFDTEDHRRRVNIDDPGVTGLWVWRKRFGKSRSTAAPQTSTLFDLSANIAFACGDFCFRFYIFDFARGIDGRYMLTQTEKNRLKDHRIYLYRDGVRVYPYGDPDDDWLNIDVTRGTGRAGDFFSNDQIIGWIDITQQGNPHLRDKTNREGLIDTGGAADDLIFLVQALLSYVKQHPYAQYKEKQRQRDATRFARDEAVGRRLAQLQEGLHKSGHESHARTVAKVAAEYQRERDHLSHRAETTEDLAGVGLSVEMASHDIMLLMNRAQEVATRLARSARPTGDATITEQADMLVGILQQITDGMRDVQVLFKSSRRRRKVLKIESLLDRIHQMYQTVLTRGHVRYRKLTSSGSPLTANTTDGVVMQVLINLFDNACYWLDTVDPTQRDIHVTVDGNHGELIFSDTGPGVDPEDLPYIFEPFYSGKGQEGRGLGLYIARQLLERHDYRIAVADDHEKVLPGANFVVSFVKEDA